MKRNYTKQFLLALFFGVSTSYAQVSIGDQPTPDANAVLDLTNGNNLGLLLPKTAANPNSSLTAVPEGMLYYYGGNVFLRGATASFNSITPWKSIFSGANASDVYFNPTGFTSSVGGVGIGLSTGFKGNLHIALKTKEVNTTNTSAPLLIGDSDAGTHLSVDSDEILVKTNTNTAGTLKLQEGAGTVQVGQSQTVPSTLNVYGKVQESGFALVPQGVIVMWSGTAADIPKGWALCDGRYYNPTDFTDGTSSATSTAVYTKVTPNLKDRFIVGAGGTYGNGGATGGATTVTLTASQCALPAHTHHNNHTHGITDPGHTHPLPLHDEGGGGYVDDSGNDYYNTMNTGSNTTGITVNDYTGDTGAVVTTPATSAHENRPPYYALAFIMKL